jgi:hypothetical protein
LPPIGGNVDDCSALVLPEMRQNCLRDLNQAYNVDIELPAYVLDGRGFQNAVGAIACVVHKHVDRPEALHAFLNCILNRGRLLDVQSRHEHVLEFVEFGFILWLSHRGDDVPALGLKMFGGGLADSAA